eukprot:CAMPEP_0184246888 /NCGR_PEP_ID=MMETSP0977-20130417/2241_1 /TAXON_ID=483370 /ORGANISM="non described non described, Strain CCMP2097" /LENGTH=341 /DNA_ID=CAMNT_0026552205 /DNA_START=39 /DNA_END=1060 /DNA_ORIENTATION=-
MVRVLEAARALVAEQFIEVFLRVLVDDHRGTVCDRGPNEAWDEARVERLRFRGGGKKLQSALARVEAGLALRLNDVEGPESKPCEVGTHSAVDERAAGEALWENALVHVVVRHKGGEEKTVSEHGNPAAREHVAVSPTPRVGQLLPDLDKLGGPLYQSAPEAAADARDEDVAGQSEYIELWCVSGLERREGGVVEAELGGPHEDSADDHRGAPRVQSEQTALSDDVQRRAQQWLLRCAAGSADLLDGLECVEWLTDGDAREPVRRPGPKRHHRTDERVLQRHPEFRAARPDGLDAALPERPHRAARETSRWTGTGTASTGTTTACTSAPTRPDPFKTANRT